MPSTTILDVTDNQSPGATLTAHDGAGRPTAAITQVYGIESWRTTTTYQGVDEVDVPPPAGAPATATISDACGRTTQLRTYHRNTPSGTYDTTGYGYDDADRQTSITDAAGNQWRFRHDLAGRQISAHDPDKGDSTSTAHDPATPGPRTGSLGARTRNVSRDAPTQGN